MIEINFYGCCEFLYLNERIVKQASVKNIVSFPAFNFDIYQITKTTTTKLKFETLIYSGLVHKAINLMESPGDVIYTPKFVFFLSLS